MTTAFVNIPGSDRKSNPVASKLFIDLCKETNLDVSVNHKGVKFTGKDKEIEQGKEIAARHGFQVKVTE
jgi:hypothetical protein